jgi:hypothetical protein
MMLIDSGTRVHLESVCVSTPRSAAARCRMRTNSTASTFLDRL